MFASFYQSSQKPMTMKNFSKKKQKNLQQLLYYWIKCICLKPPDKPKLVQYVRKLALVSLTHLALMRGVKIRERDHILCPNTMHTSCYCIQTYFVLILPKNNLALLSLTSVLPLISYYAGVAKNCMARLILRTKYLARLKLHNFFV